MSKREDNYDKKRGLRLKRFREEILKINQKDFANERCISQSKMSMIERGQMPDQALIDYYTVHGINWHWVMTGEGNMKAYKINDEKENSVDNYYSISNRLNSISNMDHMEKAFFDFKKFGELYFDIKYSSILRDTEKQVLSNRMIDSVCNIALALKAI
ncbi:MAG: helix-turn-helix transcriptional regulator [Balneola sp.]